MRRGCVSGLTWRCRAAGIWKDLRPGVFRIRSNGKKPAYPCGPSTRTCGMPSRRREAATPSIHSRRDPFPRHVCGHGGVRAGRRWSAPVLTRRRGRYRYRGRFPVAPVRASRQACKGGFDTDPDSDPDPESVDGEPDPSCAEPPRFRITLRSESGNSTPSDQGPAEPPARLNAGHPTSENRSDSVAARLPLTRDPFARFRPAARW